MKELTVEVGFTTSAMGDVDQIKLEFSEQDLTQIREFRKILLRNPSLFKMVMLFDGELLLDGEKSDFRSDGGELFIFKERLYYFTQSKYDGAVQIESQQILLVDLFTEDELDDDYRSTLTCNTCASDVDYCKCKEMTVNNAKAYLREKGYFTQNMWCDGDIIGTGENMDIEISEEQAIEIMDLMGNRFDASIGVNWDFIEVSIDEYFNDQK